MGKFKNSADAMVRRREINDQMSDLQDKLQVIDETLAKRELKDEEKAEQAKLNREFEKLKKEADVVAREYGILYQSEVAAREAAAHAEKKTSGQQLREVLKDGRKSGCSREIILGTGTDGDVTASGAINLKINDLIPTLNEGLGLPAGLNIVTGVTGNEVWPVSIDDAAMEEVGETVELTDQTLHFDNIRPVSSRVGLSISVSNTAIDNAAFDLMSFVQQKITKAQAKYLAEKVYSQAAWTGIKGPFSGATSAGTITIGTGAYKSILQAVAKFADNGYDVSKVALIIDAKTEATLKATPKADGQGGFVIENGKLAGYDYVVSHYIDTTLNADGKTLESTADSYIGIGLFPYLAVQQHGQVRLTIDPVTKAKSNLTLVTINTEWSITDLSVKTTTNGKKNTTTTAFALYKVAEA